MGPEGLEPSRIPGKSRVRCQLRDGPIVESSSRRVVERSRRWGARDSNPHDVGLKARCSTIERAPHGLDGDGNSRLSAMSMHREMVFDCVGLADTSRRSSAGLLELRGSRRVGRTAQHGAAAAIGLGRRRGWPKRKALEAGDPRGRTRPLRARRLVLSLEEGGHRGPRIRFGEATKAPRPPGVSLGGRLTSRGRETAPSDRPPR